MRNLLTCLPLFVLTLLIMGPIQSYAQGELATIKGKVTDETGAVVPGVTITAQNLETGFKRTTQTSDTGDYRLPALSPGTYEITAELAGFSKQVRRGITLSIRQEAIIDFAMKVAAMEETMFVAAEAPIVETTKSEVATGVREEMIKSLPVNTRRWIDLGLLTPGVSQDNIRGFFYNNLNIGGGTKWWANGFVVDGVSNVFAEMGEPRQNFPQDAIREFKINTIQFKAEYGLAVGGVLTTVTKSGTNEFHGSAFAFFRDKVFNARNFFERMRPPFRRWQYGGSIGGPIVKDKVFGFYSVERTSLTQFFTVFTRNLFPQEEGTFASDQFRTMHVARVDYRPNDKHSIFGRYAQENEYRPFLTSGGIVARSAGFGFAVPRRALVTGWNWILSERALSDARFQYAFAKYEVSPADTGKRGHSFAPGNFPQRRLDDCTPIVVRPSLVTGNCNSQMGPEKRWQIIESFSYFIPNRRGKHEIKTGVDLSYVDFAADILAAGNSSAKGTFFFATDKPFDPNDPTTRPFLYQQVHPTFAKKPVTHFSAYVQDDWSPLRNLTFNLGLRYDVQLGAFNEDIDKIKFPITVPFHNAKERGDHNNFGPRFGFAWDPFKDSRTVIRGGYGVYYESIQTLRNFGERWWHLARLVFIPNPSFPDPFMGRDPEEFISTAPPNIEVLANNMVNPYSQQFNLGLSREITRTLAVSVDGVYHLGLKERIQRDINYFIAPDLFVRPNRQFGRVTQWQTSGRSKYAALLVKVDKRFSRNFMFLAHYTLSRSKDNITGLPPDQFRAADEWGSGSTDRRHRFVFSGIWQLPLGFQLSPIVQLRSDLPFDITAGTARYGVPGYRPPGISRNVGCRGANIDAINAYRASIRRPPISQNDIACPGFASVDVRLSKSFTVYKESKAEFIFQVFNLFNRANFDLPIGNLSSAAFGRPLSAQDPRQMELAVRFSF